MLLENILPFVHSLLRQALKASDCALDATTRNGHDVLLLAQLVGEMGKVWAFDVQSKTPAQAQGRLGENGVDGRVTLIHDGHEDLSSYIDEPLDAAVFSLGQLPGGNKSCMTGTTSSTRVLADILGLLKENGPAVAILYPGHEAGRIEAEAIAQRAETSPQETSAVLHYGFASRRDAPPYLLTVEELRQKQMFAVKQPL